MIPKYRVSQCEYCECEITVSEDYYSFDDGDICESCIKDYLEDHKKLGG